MTEFDICRDYRLAKNKREQIKILADRNVCGVREIQEILARHGLYDGKIAAPAKPKLQKPKKEKSKGKKYVKWTADMVEALLAMREQEYKTRDIAGRLGVTPMQVTQKTYDVLKRRR